jgi:hypothetical protein
MGIPGLKEHERFCGICGRYDAEKDKCPLHIYHDRAEMMSCEIGMIDGRGGVRITLGYADFNDDGSDRRMRDEETGELLEK